MTLSKSDQHKGPDPISGTSASSRILRPEPDGQGESMGWTCWNSSCLHYGRLGAPTFWDIRLCECKRRNICMSAKDAILQIHSAPVSGSVAKLMRLACSPSLSQQSSFEIRPQSKQRKANYTSLIPFIVLRLVSSMPACSSIIPSSKKILAYPK